MTWLAYLPDLHGFLRRLTFAKGPSWGLRKRLYVDMVDMHGQLITPDIVADLRTSLLRVGRRADAEVLRKIHQRLKAGLSLSQAMGHTGVLPPTELTMLASGEANGNMKVVLQPILAMRKRIARMLTTLYTSLASPLGYCAVMYAFAYGFGAHLSPTLTTLQHSAAQATGRVATVPTGAAHALLVIGELATGYGGPALLAVAGIAVAALIIALPRWSGRLRFFLDQWVFPFTLYRDFQGALWLLNFVLMTDFGVPAAVALAEQIRYASPWLKAYLKPLQQEVATGVRLSVALRRAGHGFPAVMLIERIGRLEGTDRFVGRMRELAEDHASRVELKAKLVSALIGGVMFLACMALPLLAQAGLDDLFGGVMNQYR